MTTILDLLGKDADYLLNHQCIIKKEALTLPSGDFVSRVFAESDRNNRVLRSLQQMFDHGRLGGSGYLSILPVDQGVEHTAGASFAKNPMYFDPENIVRLAIESGCSAVASSYGVLSILARRYAHKIPFLLKLNHNELLSYPTTYHQIFFSQVEDAYNMGAVAVGATVYFGSESSNEEIVSVAKAFSRARELGLATVLWCYLRNPHFTRNGVDYHTAADLTGQADHLGATLGADIVKQKLPTLQEGFKTINFSKTDDLVYSELSSNHPIDLCRYQVLNSYCGKVGLINSGGPSSGQNDFTEAAKTAVINKRAGGMGLILGRKAFQRPFSEGVQLLNLIQDIYLDPTISIS
ncbi:fructose-bisphosphate aldolase [Chlamydia muridarum str. Nigg]|jgi:DhnA-type fructose-1,6-bisphosphate aldolase and related enzymes|uniref:Probable fructose-bisphosphate aldolase class 1 n=2 Tax=Chlamydia muridarum TaxID=83560 RepID=ALF1_CHLMU|nr:class I fructose-bisphosphate aldolase [Chlamydia muridarum]Q9PKH8.1 RecName: Full=Probable fructose-bisphosphate aldolase class 1; AltName: Full=Probable fructose-bisphosphate aldolase class I; Short=FBP aldolase [Chlamydia muridarum str. Nigg]UFW99743.1 class I fructose-bisphosphate aldolase [Chlamydia trachomatis]AAF39333.1 fructose-bisphosphate aldolase, class I [Chlamydia muridarum str. Nigg]AHH22875.1 fructose-bisphosphate aldolase [Chlamydia muridarum str. Nigg3 CMUT3-5]AHH23800.1 fr